MGIQQANADKKKARVVLLISDKVGFKQKSINKVTEVLTMIKGKSHGESSAFINILLV
jgi:hypothetical protein